MKPIDATPISQAIEALLVTRNHRGMGDVRESMVPGYLLRAARLIKECSGRVYILTGFPVGESFETDGPAGAMALYRLCKQLGNVPVILSDALVVTALCNDFNCTLLPSGRHDDCGVMAQALYLEQPPSLLISIERPGEAEDGRCYNMAGKDITERCSVAEPYLVEANCPTIAIGDGGNELGMGNVAHSLSKLNIRPAASICDELIVADVSNWAAYALCAFTYWLADSGAGSELHVRQNLEYLVGKGAIDGVTGEATPTEDGFTADEAEKLVQAVQNTLASGERV